MVGTIRSRLQLSFAAIAIAALGIALSNYLQYRRLEGDARALNLAGSQRMRAYRLATLASQYVSYRDLVTAEAIGHEIDRYRATLAALRAGDAAQGLKPPPNEEADAALAEAASLFRLFEARVRTLVDKADRGGAADLWLETQAVVAMASSLAERMDRAVSELERASSDAVRRYRNLQLALFAATAAVALVSFEGLRRAVLPRLSALESGLHEVARGHLGAEVHLGTAPDEVARLEDAFNEMSREVERVDRLKSQFLATMSHELRTPLTSVIGFAELLKRGAYGPLEPRQLDRIDAILRNARHLLALIGDILDLAKIEADKIDLHPVPVALGRLVADVADVLRPLADAKRLALETSVPEDLPTVETDPDRLRQILLNLGSNAVKFTDAGSVRLRAAPVRGRRAVRIEVEDTGIGIAPRDLPRLFGRFEQLDASPTRRHGGSGLGLHISRRLAGLLGAAIEVASEPGHGSRFAVLLPERFSGPAGAADPSADLRKETEDQREALRRRALTEVPPWQESSSSTTIRTS